VVDRQCREHTQHPVVDSAEAQRVENDVRTVESGVAGQRAAVRPSRGCQLLLRLRGYRLPRPFRLGRELLRPDVSRTEDDERGGPTAEAGDGRSGPRRPAHVDGPVRAVGTG
jgi:hypothetical protein